MLPLCHFSRSQDYVSFLPIFRFWGANWERKSHPVCVCAKESIVCSFPFSMIFYVALLVGGETSFFLFELVVTFMLLAFRISSRHALKIWIKRKQFYNETLRVMMNEVESREGESALPSIVMTREMTLIQQSFMLLVFNQWLINSNFCLNWRTNYLLSIFAFREEKKKIFSTEFPPPFSFNFNISLWLF